LEIGARDLILSMERQQKNTISPTPKIMKDPSRVKHFLEHFAYNWMMKYERDELSGINPLSLLAPSPPPYR